MRLAFTYNEQRSDREEEAEFDTPETIATLTDALRSLGHEVEPIEVSGPLGPILARLEAFAPELVFNAAEGAKGRARESFFPALFERLDLPFTGADAAVCALTLNKQLTKLALAPHGVPSPRGALITRLDALDVGGWRFPIIAKPNFEGSSIGITAASVVDDLDALRDLVVSLLARFPAGVLVEEFIVGRDVVVPYLEGVSPETGGVLEPASTHVEPSLVAGRRHQLYDYTLKTAGAQGVSAVVPAEITAAERERAVALARVTFQALGVRDLGRIDLRVAEDGAVYFIEANALPSLEPGASIYRSAALVGLDDVPSVLDAVIRSAVRRAGLLG